MPDDTRANRGRAHSRRDRDSQRDIDLPRLSRVDIKEVVKREGPGLGHKQASEKQRIGSLVIKSNIYEERRGK